MRIKLKRLHRVESKGRVYYYAWRGGPRIKTDAAPGSPSFMQAYNEVVATVRAPTTDKVVSLIKLYKGKRLTIGCPMYVVSSAILNPAHMHGTEVFLRPTRSPAAHRG
jgi:hypothetical protein